MSISRLRLKDLFIHRAARIALLYRLRTCCLRIKCLREGPARNLAEFAVELVTIIARVTLNARPPTPHLTLTTPPFNSSLLHHGVR